MSKHKDKLAGGLADKKSPKDFDAEQLRIGIQHELEHTNDKSIAQEIAMDHLSEDPDYYKKLKNIEKYDRKEVAPDGKYEFDYGAEDLNKLKESWKRLKKALLDSDKAIIDLSTQEYDDEEQEPETEEQEQEAEEQEPETEEQESEAEEQEPETEEQEQEPEAEEPQPEETEAEQGQDVEQPDEQEDISEEELAELERLLQQEGYSDAEIAHIVHGHVIPQQTSEDIEADTEQAKAQQDIQHKAAMNELEYQTAAQQQLINQMDAEHKKRMLDLELEAAKKEKEMELEFKQKELALKLEIMRRKAEKQLNNSGRESNIARDASTTSQAEKEGK